MAASVNGKTPMLKESVIDEPLENILIPIIESLKVQDAEVINFKNEVTYHQKIH